MDEPQTIPIYDQALLAYPLLDRADVAAILRVRVGTVDTLYRTKQIAGVMVGQNLRFKRGDVLAFVERLERHET